MAAAVQMVNITSWPLKKDFEMLSDEKLLQNKKYCFRIMYL